MKFEFVLQLVFIVGTMVVVTAVMWAVGAVIDGWVLSILWGWFVVPVFHLAPLTLVPAIGLALTIGFLVKKLSPSDEETSPRPDTEKAMRADIEKTGGIGVSRKLREMHGKMARKLAMLWLAPFITLFLGWCVHQFM